jgi:hypothetical protein
MSSDSKNVIDKLSTTWDISEEQQQVLLAESTKQCHSVLDIRQPGQASPSSYAVGITTVSTFIAQKNLPGSNFVVPSFASHWGIVCDFSHQRRTLFHWRFNSVVRKIYFKAESWNPEWDQHQVKQIGTTSYGYAEIDATGTRLSLRLKLMLTVH